MNPGATPWSRSWRAWAASRWMAWDYMCRAGESLVMPAQKPHAVYGEEDFKMLLTVVFPPEEL